MPNPQEIDQETREAMEALGFKKTHKRAFTKERPEVGPGFHYWVWFPGRWSHNRHHWLADKGLAYGDLEKGAGQLFDDPISAAVWLNVEASHG